MKKTILLLSKDCMPLEAIPYYGGCKYWQGKTPNIDELAKKGTVFYRHYTAAPSTSMAMSAMLTGHYLYEFEKRKGYFNVTPSEFPSIYDDFQEHGYECHLLWDVTWMGFAWRFVREFGDENKTIIHNLDIAQPAGTHKKDGNRIVRNNHLLEQTYKQIYDTLNAIDFSKKQFVWVHLPHVLKGRRSYQDDMDVFDNIVGFCRNLVGDENIFLTTDHGHMNLHRHKVCYGFDVYEQNIHIPLITPRINDIERVDTITSNIDLPEILKGNIPKHDFVVSDTKYYAQPNRKISITGQRFKLIYNAKDDSEELYDLDWDPLENHNILEESFYDKDRGKWVQIDELYFYPYVELAKVEYKKLNEIRMKIWKKPTLSESFVVCLKQYRNKIKNKLNI